MDKTMEPEEAISTYRRNKRMPDKLYEGHEEVKGRSA
jgi:hypothetical protein